MSARQAGGGLSSHGRGSMSLYCLAPFLCQAPSLSQFPRPCLSTAILEQDHKPRQRLKLRPVLLLPRHGLWTCHF